MKKRPFSFFATFVMLLTAGIAVAQDTTMTITPAGNVGIGKSAPTYKLDVNGEVNATGVRVNGVPVSTGSGSHWDMLGNNIFNTNIGNVGIGTTSPTSMLEVNGSVKAAVFIGDGSQLTNLSTDSSQWTTSGNNIYNGNSGKVGIGTNNPDAKLGVSGGDIGADEGGQNTGGTSYGIRFGGFGSAEFIGSKRNSGGNQYGLDFYTSGSARLTIQNNGSICYTGTLGACSDLRYKENITPLSDALAKVTRIQAVSYNWKVDEFPEKKFTRDRQIGVIAQEIEKIYPELVLTDADGYKSVDYAKLTPILVEAVKTLKAGNEILTSRLDDLETLVKSLVAEKNGVRDQSLGELH